MDNEITRQAMMIGYLNDFWLLTLLAASIVPLVLLLRRQERTPSPSPDTASSSSKA